MIKIKPAKWSYGRGLCICCFGDNDTKKILFAADSTTRIVIILCKKCRTELIDAIRADDSEVTK